MNNELKVSFYLKRESRLEKSGAGEKVAYPITGKIIIGNSIAQFSTKLKVEERLWHVKSGRATGKSRVAVELNREINKINLGIHTHYKDILGRTGTVTAVEVKNAFQGIASSQKTLLVLFEEMMWEFHSRVGIDRSISTYKQYRKTFVHLRRFIPEKYKVKDMPLNRMDLPFIEAFDFNLRVERKMKAGSVVAIMVPLQKAARIAFQRRLINLPPFFGYKPEKPRQQVRSLTKDEFERLISTTIQQPDLRLVRDLFVFASFTGISYADLKRITRKNIIRDETGDLWISMSRQKTGVPFNVKLLDIPMQIMEKYRGLAKDDLVFPVPEQGYMNIKLKTVAKYCGLERTISFHQSRHSFASLVCLSQGVPMESVSHMLGHRDIQTTQRYAHVDKEKISSDMKLLSARIADKFQD